MSHEVAGRTSKADVVRTIAEKLGIPVPPMSTGSTEPRAIFDAVNRHLHLGIPVELTKPQTARAIVESTGRAWLPTYDSRGGTVTLAGLRAVLAAVEDYVG